MRDNCLNQYLKLLKKSNINFYICVSGNSMYPTLKNNDRLLIETDANIHYKIGDIVVFESGEVRVVHRIIKKENNKFGDFFITKGDNNMFPDQLICLEQIIGKVVAVNGKKLSSCK